MRFENEKQREAAEYLGELAQQLARHAHDAGLETLTYLFDMAAMESRQVRGIPERQLN